MKTTSKFLLLLLLILSAFSCSIEPNEESVDKLSLISDKEILEFKIAVQKQSELINVEKFGKYAKYSTYEEFVANSTTEQQVEMVQELNIKPIEDLTLVIKIYNFNLSRTDLNRLIKRFEEMPVNKVNGKVNTCEDYCFDHKWSVYWTTFWNLQVAGDNMYDAHDDAMIAASYAYTGCLHGCGYPGN